MESLPLTVLLFFLILFAAVLMSVLWLVVRRRGSERAQTKRTTMAADRRHFAALLHDDIGQKFAAARVNLSALRLQLRTGGLRETAELDAAMDLLDDGCRDLRTVSRLMANNEMDTPSTAMNDSRDEKGEPAASPPEGG